MKKFSKATMAMAANHPNLVARLTLAFIASVLVILLGLMGMSSGPNGAAVFAQETPTPTPTPTEPAGPTGPTVAFVNPTPYENPALGVSTDDDPDVSDKFDGVDTAYHVVAWASSVPPNAVLEAYYIPETVAGIPLSEITIGQLEPVPGSDTYDYFWDIPESVPEGTGTMVVRMFATTIAGFEEVANDEVAVEMRHQEGGRPPQGDAQAASETVELTWPTQNGPAGFFKPKGGAWRTVVDGTVSEVPLEQRKDALTVLLVQLYYTTSGPGEKPEWKFCGDEGGLFAEYVGGPFRSMCTLEGKDTPSMVGAMSAQVFQEQNPDAALQNYTEEASDAHRVKAYVQNPDTMKIDFVPFKTPDTGGTYREVVATNPQNNEPNRCISFTAEVTDPLGRPVQGANVDAHISGPTDQLAFGEEDPSPKDLSAADTSAYKNPDKGGHSVESAHNCDRGAQEDPDEQYNANPVEGQQGDHNVPGGADVKHRESVQGSGLSGGEGITDDAGFGRWNFQLWSPTVGTSQVTAWVDDESIASEDEARAADTDTLDPGEPSTSGIAQWLPAAITVTMDPPSDTAPVGSCNRYNVRVRGGSQPIVGINVDVHATGPSGELDFCDPGDATDRRAPDTTGDDQDHEAEDELESRHRPGAEGAPQVQHTEGETDDQGNFVIGITSPVTGDTTIEAWVDGERGGDNDIRDTGEVGGLASKSWASGIGDAEVSFVNPSPYGVGTPIVSNKPDANGQYHIVTRVDAVDVPAVELFIGSGSTFTKIGDATRVGSSDTYDFMWPVTVPDGNYTLRAQIAGTNRIKDQAITVNKDAAPNPQDQPSETLEITEPVNAQTVAFSNRATEIAGVASGGAEGIDLFYTKVGAKDTPQQADWISCGFVQPGGNGAFSGTCRLQASDVASQVTGVAAITYDCTESDCNPAPPQPPPPPAPTPPREPGTRESGDAHRVFGLEGRPLVSIEPAEAADEPGTCKSFTMSVRDASGQALGNEPVDVHLSGPGNDAEFCTPATGGSPSSPPAEGGHTVIAGDNEGIHDDTTPYTKHIEGTTNSSGRFTFGVTSPTEGDSQIFAWVDQLENDVLDANEGSDTSLMHWTSQGTEPNPNPNRCTIKGDGGDNVLRGTPRRDVICGLGGADRLIGRGGNDLLKGGAGKDIARGGGGKDVLRGGGGADRLRGGGGGDRLHGNGGNDFLNGQAGRDSCRGGTGRNNYRSCETKR